jgi:hypothetical protein
MRYRVTSITDTPFRLPYGNGEPVLFGHRGASAELDFEPHVAERLGSYGTLKFEPLDPAAAQPLPQPAAPQSKASLYSARAVGDGQVGIAPPRATPFDPETE